MLGGTVEQLVHQPAAFKSAALNIIEHKITLLLSHVVKYLTYGREPSGAAGKPLHQRDEPLIDFARIVAVTEMRIHDAQTTLRFESLLVSLRDRVAEPTPVGPLTRNIPVPNKGALRVMVRELAPRSQRIDIAEGEAAAVRDPVPTQVTPEIGMIRLVSKEFIVIIKSSKKIIREPTPATESPIAPI